MIVFSYTDKIQGILSCYDRILVQGNLGWVGYADGMSSYLYAQGIRIFDYKKFAEPLRDQIQWPWLAGLEAGQGRHRLQAAR